MTGREGSQAPFFLHYFPSLLLLRGVFSGTGGESIISFISLVLIDLKRRCLLLGEEELLYGLATAIYLKIPPTFLA